MEDDSAIAILTRESVGEIIHSGGSASWVLTPRRARRTRYLVCVRNDRNTDPNAGETHGTAFLIGLISGLELVDDKDGDKRWRLTFGAFARTSIPGVWGNWRNPVRYTTLKDLGIDAGSLDFSLPERVDNPDLMPPRSVDDRPMTIAEAKSRLAKSLGVEPEQIEITVRA